MKKKILLIIIILLVVLLLLYGITLSFSKTNNKNGTIKSNKKEPSINEKYNYDNYKIATNNLVKCTDDNICVTNLRFTFNKLMPFTILGDCTNNSNNDIDIYYVTLKFNNDDNLEVYLATDDFKKGVTKQCAGYFSSKFSDDIENNINKMINAKDYSISDAKSYNNVEQETN